MTIRFDGTWRLTVSRSEDFDGARIYYCGLIGLLGDDRWGFGLEIMEPH